MTACARCERPSCPGHWVDTPDAINLTRPYLRPETTGVVWSALFPPEVGHGEPRTAG